MTDKTDVLIIGAGLAGLVAASEAVARGRRVIMLDQEGPQSLGGQAFWSLGGLFMVDTPEQGRMGIRDTPDLALRDWMGSAQFDRPEDHWPRAWAEAYLNSASGEMRSWLHGMGMRWFPVVGWAERGGADAIGHGYSWFILTQKIIEKEFALSGSEQNEDFTSKSWRMLLRDRLSKGAPKAVEAFKDQGEDFIVATNLGDLVSQMNALSDDNQLSEDHLRAQIEARDGQIGNPFSKDAQVVAMNGARKYRGDRLIRVAKPHRILDPNAGPLIAVRLHILTRKSLGGLETDLDARALGMDGAPVPGLFAAGEVAGFGGGGYHGYNALEGTFLGGCLFSGRIAGQTV